MHSVGSRNVLGEISKISTKKNFENLRSFPPAGLSLPNLGQAFKNVTSAKGKLQAVRKDRFLSGTSMRPTVVSA
jgi:hypothetical protein